MIRQTTLRKDTRGRKFFKLTMVREGRREIHRIYELSPAEVRGYKHMGMAEGLNIGHCIFVASRNEENFLSRVCGFRIKNSMETARGREARLQVSFYEKRKKEVQ